MQEIKIGIADTYKIDDEGISLNPAAYDRAVRTALAAAVAAARAAGATGAVVLDGQTRIGCDTEFRFRIDESEENYSVINDTTLFERVWISSNLPGCSGRHTVRTTGALI